MCTQFSKIFNALSLALSLFALVVVIVIVITITLLDFTAMSDAIPNSARHFSVALILQSCRVEDLRDFFKGAGTFKDKFLFASSFSQLEHSVDFCITFNV